MGCFLCISIVTDLCMSKKEVKECRLEEKDVVSKALELYGLDPKMYVLSQSNDEDDLLVELNAEVLRQDLISFLEDFYQDYYGGDKEMYEDALAELHATPHDKWINLAKEKSYKSYHYNVSMYQKAIRIDYSQRIRVACGNIILCLNGKIIMECYNQLFYFLQKCIRDRYPSHPLARTLNVFITD